MKSVIALLAVSALIFPSLCYASEEFDPLLYPESDEVQSDADVRPVQNPAALMASPKLMDDEDLNFENMDFDALGEENAPASSSEMTRMPATVSVSATSPATVSKVPEPPAPSEVPSPPTVDKNKPLTENFQDNPQSSTEDSLIPLPKVEKTWIAKIKSPLGSDSNEKTQPTPDASGKVNLESLVEKSKKTVRRSNASVFDISGAMLRMSFKQIDEILTRRGFRRTVQKLDIPNFIRWRNEDKCRSSGVVGYERLENCVIQMAKKNSYQYVERATYSKFDTREEIEVRFTSTFTNNKAYRISYKSEAAVNITGNSQKQIYLRNIKVYDFWKKINQKYGTPDNKDDVIWGLGGNKPYLQAGTGRLVLEDPMLRELDYTRMSREDQKFMNTDLYSF